MERRIQKLSAFIALAVVVTTGVCIGSQYFSSYSHPVGRVPLVAKNGLPKPSGYAFSFGVVPQHPASKLARLWQPLVDELEARSGVTLHFHTAKDIPTFERRLAAGEYDFAYVSPYHYVVSGKMEGYRAFAKEKERELRGILVVRKDSPLTELDDLGGKVVAFPAPLAFGATVLPLSHLARNHVDVTPAYVGSHDSVYRAVAANMYLAGGGILRTFEAMNPAIRGQLRILAATDGYTPHAFVAHPRVDPAVVSKVQAAMISLSDSPEDRIVLDALGFKGIVQAHDGEWNDMRTLDIEALHDNVKQGE